MRRKYYMLGLLTMLVLGTISAISPPAKAPDGPVSIYIKDPADGDDIYPGLPPPGPPFYLPNVYVYVYISSPLSWMDTSDGIVAFTLSVRVDPRALEVVDFQVGYDGTDDYTGVPDTFLEMYALMKGWSTLSAAASKDTVSGTMWGFGDGIAPLPTIGAGGDPINLDDEMPLCRIRFKSKSETLASPIDLMGPGSLVEGIVKVSARYTNGRGETFEVEPGDGYYVATTPDITFSDNIGSPEVIGSHWHELWPVYCREWRIDSHEDTDADGLLDASEQIDITRLMDGYKAWYHVEWVNPDPVPGDGKADLIVKFKSEVPEFPLGIGILMILAPLIPIIYLVRRKEWKK